MIDNADNNAARAILSTERQCEKKVISGRSKDPKRWNNYEINKETTVRAMIVLNMV